jgi:hypothetical protein
MASRQQEIAMDLAQKANRVKRELQAAAHKPEELSIRHAVEAFDAFVDGVVEEIGQLKSALKTGSASADDAVKGLGEAVVSRSDAPDVEPVEGRGAGKALEPEHG